MRVSYHLVQLRIPDGLSPRLSNLTGRRVTVEILFLGQKHYWGKNIASPLNAGGISRVRGKGDDGDVRFWVISEPVSMFKIGPVKLNDGMIFR